MKQQIRFTTTPDGVRIAYALIGEGPPVLYVNGWPEHLELEWEQPFAQSFLARLAQGCTLVRYTSSRFVEVLPEDFQTALTFSSPSQTQFAFGGHLLSSVIAVTVSVAPLGRAIGWPRSALWVAGGSSGGGVGVAVGAGAGVVVGWTVGEGWGVAVGAGGTVAVGCAVGWAVGWVVPGGAVAVGAATVGWAVADGATVADGSAVGISGGVVAAGTGVGVGAVAVAESVFAPHPTSTPSATAVAIAERSRSSFTLL